MTLHLDDILAKAFENSLTQDDFPRLIAPANQEERDKIQTAARKMRQLYTGDKIFTSGFIYFSTWCRNDCHFCAYRLSSKEAKRYRKTPEEVLAAAKLLASQGVNNIDLTLGEDPAIDQQDFSDKLAQLISDVKETTGLPVMISPGVVKPHILQKFKQAGADWYACYQETYNPDLFSRLRQGQCFETRRLVKAQALEAGLLVEEGVLCGVGETVADLAESIQQMKELGAQQVRAMGFVPPTESVTQVAEPISSPAESLSTTDKPLNQGGQKWVPAPPKGVAQTKEVDMIAALRLALPGCLIPASLDVEGLVGLQPRLAAGANLITSLVPADLALSGVAQASLDINNQARSVEGIRPLVLEAGLRLASPAEYQAWVLEAQAKL